MILLSPLGHGEEFKPLTFKQDIDGKEFVYSVGSGTIISVNQGCRGFLVNRLEHDVPNELKLEIKHLWDISATFDGKQDQEAIKAMVGKTYLFKYRQGLVISVEEVN